MKKIVLSIVFIFGVMSIIYAQTMDTVVIDPGVGTLKAAIDDPNNVGKVFKLKRGETYLVDAVIEYSDTASHQPLIIVGEEGPANVPPAAIHRLTPPGEAGWTHSIIAESDMIFKNIYFAGRTPLNEQLAFTLDIKKTGGTLKIDHCIFEGFWWSPIQLGADSVTLEVKNSLVINLMNKNNWQHGLLYFSWGNKGLKIHVYNNTFMFMGSGLRYTDGALTDEIIFDHNTVVFSNKTWFDNEPILKLQVTNNIFYNMYMRGYVGPRPAWGYEGDHKKSETDTLAGIIGVYSTASLGIPDASREHVWSNNLRYTSQLVLDFQNSITATYQPTFNDTTQWMFDTYPNMVAENNIEETLNPNFTQLPDEATVLENYFKWIRGKRDTTQRTSDWPQDWSWYWDGDTVFIKSWPLPVDLKPQEKSLIQAGSDGYPLGDLNWYGADVVKAWEAGEPNPLTSIDEGSAELPVALELGRNYPNPFNPTTTIKYSINRSSHVSVNIYDLLGRRIRVLVDERKAAGSYKVQWDGKDHKGKLMPSGVYFYELKVGTSALRQKMLLVK